MKSRTVIAEYFTVTAIYRICLAPAAPAGFYISQSIRQVGRRSPVIVK